jgi:hypothetical protein
MESHHGEIQELARPTSPPPPQNIGDEPPKTEETKKDYHKGCPGCQLEEANEIRTGIPYLNFFYICIIGLTSSKYLASAFCFSWFLKNTMLYMF